MRVFVTGATGFVGSAVVQELLAAGHQVLGLARSDAGAAALVKAGAEVHRGSLEDLDSLTTGAAAADGVIHTAFNHDFSKFAENCEAEQHAIAALGKGLEGSDRPLVVTSGLGLLKPGVLATEDDRRAPDSRIPRDPEGAADLLASKGVRVSVIRLSPSVHGDGDHGFVPILIGLAKEKGESVYVGEGLNRWPGVHRLDAAVLYRLALEKGAARATYHGADEQGVPFREIAEVIGRRLQVPVVSRTQEEAAGHFGWFAHFAAIDCLVSSEKTRAELGWQPVQAGLITDIDHPRYFGG
ncbi:MAG: 3-beta hydroxysteroid dehydrogenase [Akkermansiaceae bacterium]|nr:3-beta hydroxysteroid dehydrogenase [Akkermansiaceae bacterium]